MNQTQPAAFKAINLAASDPAQPYSDAVRQGEFLFLSGRIGIGTDGALVDGGVVAEFEQAVANIKQVLALAGLSLDNVVRVSVFLISMADYAAMNAAYLNTFSSPLPARTCVAVRGLPLDASVEIEVLARANAI